MSEENLTPWQQWKKNLGDSRPWDLFDSKLIVDKEISNSRLSICIKCPELIQATKQCKKCGCFMAGKTKLENASCPLGKW